LVPGGALEKGDSSNQKIQSTMKTTSFSVRSLSLVAAACMLAFFTSRVHSQNTATGSNALLSVMPNGNNGVDNTADGANALGGDVTGSLNTATGFDALLNLVQGTHFRKKSRNSPVVGVRIKSIGIISFPTRKNGVRFIPSKIRCGKESRFPHEYCHLACPGSSSNDMPLRDQYTRMVTVLSDAFQFYIVSE
jgi:hypothetical protein